jgi:hypothetical protein
VRIRSPFFHAVSCDVAGAAAEPLAVSVAFGVNFLLTSGQHIIRRSGFKHIDRSENELAGLCSKMSCDAIVTGTGRNQEHSEASDPPRDS